MKAIHHTCAVALAILALALPVLAAEPTVQQVTTIRSQVGQVIATNCGVSGDRSGTAFVWPDAQRVVTARHVVAGCSKLRVQFPGGASFLASPERELAARDLVLLKLDSASKFPPLTIEDQIPPLHSRVAAIGYALGAPTPDDKLLTVTVGNAPPGAKLSDMLEQRFQQQILTSGALLLDTKILRLDGNLVSGLSGAPLIGPSGDVVAVGSGGLRDGAGGIVWAVRASYLSILQQQAPITSVKALARTTGLVFADQAAQTALKSQQCGLFTLSRARTVPMSQLAATSDDPGGLTKLLSAIGPSLSAAGSDEFDVWVDIESGAAIPLPAGTNLQIGTTGCTATLSAGVSFNIDIVRIDPNLPPTVGAQTASVAKEYSIGAVYPGIATDPAFTYFAPLIRQDGFAVSRKAFGRVFYISPDAKQFDYIFLTHMTRSQTYVAVSAYRTMIMTAAQDAACATHYSAPGCSADPALLRDWALAAAAVQLATIPPI